MQSDTSSQVITRLFIDAPLKPGGVLQASSSQAHHLQHVLRARSGSLVGLFNGTDGEWMAKVSMGPRSDVSFLVGSQSRRQTLGDGPWLLFAPVKRLRLDFLIQKSVELGAELIQPVRTRRTVVRRVNSGRLRANAIEAAEQCGRLTVPKTHAYAAMAEVIEDWPVGRTLFWGDETGHGTPALHAFREGGRDAAFLIGPEGGFEDSERTYLRGHDFARAIDLGTNVLRSDTAALVALALWQGALNDCSRLRENKAN